MTRDESMWMPFDRSARLADSFFNWFEENSEWLQAEYEEKFDEVCDEKDMKKFKKWAQEQYNEMMRAA